MATFHRDGDRILLFFKGASEVLLPLCRTVRYPEGDRPLSGPAEEVARWVLSAAPLKLVEEVLAP